MTTTSNLLFYYRKCGREIISYWGRIFDLIFEDSLFRKKYIGILRKI